MRLYISVETLTNGLDKSKPCGYRDSTPTPSFHGKAEIPPSSFPPVLSGEEGIDIVPLPWAIDIDLRFPRAETLGLSREGVCGRCAMANGRFESLIWRCIVGASAC